MKIAIPSFDGSGLESDISAHFGKCIDVCIIVYK